MDGGADRQPRPEDAWAAGASATPAPPAPAPPTTPVGTGGARGCLPALQILVGALLVAIVALASWSLQATRADFVAGDGSKVGPQVTPSWGQLLLPLLFIVASCCLSFGFATIVNRGGTRDPSSIGVALAVATTTTIGSLFVLLERSVVSCEACVSRDGFFGYCRRSEPVPCTDEVNRFATDVLRAITGAEALLLLLAVAAIAVVARTISRWPSPDRRRAIAVAAGAGAPTVLAAIAIAASHR